LVRFALGVRDDQLSGGPGWLNTQRYDVVAKAGGLTGGDDELRPLVANMIEDRFKLKVHRVTKSYRCSRCRWQGMVRN